MIDIDKEQNLEKKYNVRYNLCISITGYHLGLILRLCYEVNLFFFTICDLNLSQGYWKQKSSVLTSFFTDFESSEIKSLSEKLNKEELSQVRT